LASLNHNILNLLRSIKISLFYYFSRVFVDMSILGHIRELLRWAGYVFHCWSLLRYVNAVVQHVPWEIQTQVPWCTRFKHENTTMWQCFEWEVPFYTGRTQRRHVLAEGNLTKLVLGWRHLRECVSHQQEMQPTLHDAFLCISSNIGTQTVAQIAMTEFILKLYRHVPTSVLFIGVARLDAWTHRRTVFPCYYVMLRLVCGVVKCN
jgi:hypothetical protein